MYSLIYIYIVIYLLWLVYVFCCSFFFFFKQKTAYEMRISDWSSDVCSSDLHVLAAIDGQRRAGDEIGLVGDQEQDPAGDVLRPSQALDRYAGGDLLQHLGRYRAHHVGVDIAGGDGEIGRASCRERGWQYV